MYTPLVLLLCRCALCFIFLSCRCASSICHAAPLLRRQGFLSRTDSLGLGPRRSRHPGPITRPQTLTTSTSPLGGTARRYPRPPSHIAMQGSARPAGTLGFATPTRQEWQWCRVFHFFATKCAFSPQPISCPLFLNEDDRIKKNRLSKLHDRF